MKKNKYSMVVTLILFKKGENYKVYNWLVSSDNQEGVKNGSSKIIKDEIERIFSNQSSSELIHLKLSSDANEPFATVYFGDKKEESPKVWEFHSNFVQ